MNNGKTQTGFTLIELLVVMSIIAVLLSILLPSLGKARESAMLQKDASRVRAIHAGWLTWATSHDERYPTPGLVDRLADHQGNQIKGRGPEDKEANTTSNIHSLSLMNNLYSPDLIVSDNEPNDNVFVLEDYDYDQYNAGTDSVFGVDGDTYWDDSLHVDLSEGGAGCNVSYASIPLIGERKEKHWSSGGPSNFAILSNRGPLLDTSGAVPFRSLTYEIHGGGRSWIGNVCWQDNHITTEESMVPKGSLYPTGEMDNIFDCCLNGVCNPFAEDSWLVLVSELNDTGGTLFPYMLSPTLQWDDEQ
mgnify:CR=1 FL=1